MGIFSGIISDKVNRKVFAGVACILWSLTTLLTGLIDSFAMMFVLRILLGFFESPFTPCAYGIISDYFHPENRGLANSLFNSAIYLGAALSSLAVVMIQATGWRNTFSIIGLVGIGAGVIGLIFIIEPTRGKFEQKRLKKLL